MLTPNKSLGQHWLRDRETLEIIASYANLAPDDVVLEIGAGLGTLTAVLSEQARRVIAIEFDRELAKNLSAATHGLIRTEPAKNGSKIEVIQADFLKFDLDSLPDNYKIVANIPYYITAKIVRKILTASNQPSVAVLLVQREVAERIAAKPGDMSLLSVSAQVYSEVSLGAVVPAHLFTPPPKVDSQVVILKPHKFTGGTDEKTFFRVVKAGFSTRRKKLRTALSGGLNISVNLAEKLLHTAEIDPNLRAQDLSIEQWYNLTTIYEKDLAS